MRVPDSKCCGRCARRGRSHDGGRLAAAATLFCEGGHAAKAGEGSEAGGSGATLHCCCGNHLSLLSVASPPATSVRWGARVNFGFVALSRPAQPSPLPIAQPSPALVPSRGISAHTSLPVIASFSLSLSPILLLTTTTITHQLVSHGQQRRDRKVSIASLWRFSRSLCFSAWSSDVDELQRSI